MANVPPAPETAEAAGVSLLLTASAVVGAMLTLGGVLWWLLKPRVQAKLEELVGAATFTRQQLDAGEPESVAADVRQALDLALGIPALTARVGRLEHTVEPVPALEELANANHAQLEAHALELTDHRRRLGNLEEAAITGRFRCSPDGETASP